MEITTYCPQCKEPSIWNETQTQCKNGHTLLSFTTDRFSEDRTLNQCPVCGAPHIYQQKDFNRRLGVSLIIVGVALAYFTYGLSLLAVTVIDWLIYKRVGIVGLCYKCQAQFRKNKAVEALPPFNLSLHDYYKNLNNNRD